MLNDFYTQVIQRDPRYTSPERCNDPNMLDPRMLRKVLAIIAGAKAQGTNLAIYETFRSQARQEQLFQQGATQLKTVGVHNYGLACDIVLVDASGNPSWNSNFQFLQPLAREQKLIWGGDWGTPDQPHSFRDTDHVQWCSIAHQDPLFAGTWYPSDEYDPYP